MLLAEQLQHHHHAQQQQRNKHPTPNKAMHTVAIIAAFLICFSPIVTARFPVIISELMINPTVGKAKGTWFEFYNPENQPLNLSNRYLSLGTYNASKSDLNTPGLQYTAIKIPAGLTIPPKGYFVFGNNNNRTTNGNVSVDYMYSPNVEMNETFGLVGLSVPNVVNYDVVSVYWGVFGASPGPFSTNASLSFRNVTNLSPSPFAFYINPLGLVDYCVSVTSYTGGPLGAKGTPNASNVCVLPTALVPTQSPTKAPQPNAAPQSNATPPSGTAPQPNVPQGGLPAPITPPTTAAPTGKKSNKCGLLGLRIICPCTRCGMVGRGLGWCKN
jgi:hypothetical protein